MTKFPIGIQNFQKLRESGFLYVDKTALIHRLVSTEGYYFLSRPRRFGKSLLVSTLEAYYQGKKELFKGLALERLEKDWTVHPVFHIDLNAERYVAPEGLFSILDRHLRKWETTYGKTDGDKTPADRFVALIQRAYEQTGQKVVILVDEYDKPLLQAIGNKALQDEYRAMLKSVYGVAKSMDGYIQMAFFTGVTKFSKVSVFSDLNNLMDITLDSQFEEICGITEREIRENFDEDVAQMAEANRLTKDECYAKLKENYDGYHFSEDSVGMYNPFSLLNALKTRKLKDYWFETGTPTFLVETLKRNNYELENMTREEVTADLLGSLDSIDQNPLPLLYQSGYLTIKDYNPDFGTYTLGFPNGEVERGFTRFLFRHYAPIKIYESDAFVKNFTIEVRNGQPEKFMPRLEAMFANQDYQLVGNTELYFHNVTSLVFKMLGFYTDVERHTTDGRMDMLVQTKDFIYIFEFKIDKSAEEALRQIEEKQYAKPFETDSRKLYKIGVNFSSATRRIESWKVVEG
ncbi:MAG: ATP-binding protein [Bacteroidales bacterium]|nr:ATP-binding protein [Bacteroidales bacterium]